MVNKDKEVDSNNDDDADLFYIEEDELEEMPQEVQDAIYEIRGQWID